MKKTKQIWRKSAFKKPFIFLPLLLLLLTFLAVGSASNIMSNVLLADLDAQSEGGGPQNPGGMQNPGEQFPGGPQNSEGMSGPNEFGDFFEQDEHVDFGPMEGSDFDFDQNPGSGPGKGKNFIPGPGLNQDSGKGKGFVPGPGFNQSSGKGKSSGQGFGSGPNKGPGQGFSQDFNKGSGSGKGGGPGFDPGKGSGSGKFEEKFDFGDSMQFQPDDKQNGNYDNQGQSDNQWTPSEKDCKNDYKMAKRVENELKQFVKFAGKKKSDTSVLSESLVLVQQAKEKLESCTVTGEEFKEIKEMLMGENGVQNNLSVFRCQNEYDRSKKEQERRKKDFEMSRKHLEKMKKTVSGEMSQKIDEQLLRIVKLQQNQEQGLKLMDETGCKIWSGDDYSDQSMQWEDLNMENQDLMEEMDSFWADFESVQDLVWAEEMFGRIEEEVQNAYKNEYPKMPKKFQEKFDVLASAVKELVAKGRECQKANDSECIKQIQDKLDGLAEKGAELFAPPDVDFKKYGFDETVNKNFKNVSKDMNYSEANEVINYLLSLDPTLAAKITDPVMADKVFKIMGRVPEKLKNQYLNDVGDLKEVFDQAVKNVPDLANYKEEILGYNYFGTGAEGLIKELEALRDGQITVAELLAELENFRSSSRKAEVEIGVTKFEDATTDTWFYDAANKEEFNLVGKKIDGKQVFDASGTTTFAEMLKVLAEALNLKPVEGEANYAKAGNHWSKGYYKAVEGKNITLMPPDHKITRGEMARLIIEMFSLQVENVPTKFSDLKGNPFESHIATLYSLGVINGDANSDKVRPNDTINRAEAFTLAKNALEKLQYLMVDEAQIDSYTNLDKIK